ncbi:MAG: O-antigen ligase family protein, partial [Chloroflexi bacterium]|nr:O-antigen ligase family protein [Chloroflexota bacterium]
MSVGETGVTNVERETALAPVDASGVCSKVAEWGLLSLLVLLPLVFTTDFTVNLFDLPKVTALRVVTVVILAALAIRAVLNGRLNLRRTRLDYPVLIFFGVAIVALFHTVSFPVSLMGEYGREDGFITLANYLVLFYFVVNLLTSRQLVKTALILQALTGFAVSIMALLESFAITPFPFAPGSFFDNRVFASLGNPDFLGTYMVMVIPISLGLMLESYGSKQRAVWGAISVVAVSALFLTYTRGAWIAAVASILVFLLVWRQIWKYKFSVLGIVLAVIVVLVILDLPVVSSWQASLLMNQRAQRENSHLAVQTSTGPVQSNRGQGNSTTSSAPVEQPSATQRAASGLNLESGTVAIRLQIWRSALPLVVENPLIGTGLNSFQSVFTKHASPEYAAGEGKTRFPDRAHNEYLHLAVTTGLLGLGAYLSILAVFGWRLLAWFRSHKGYRSRILLVAILASWTAYLVSNFFLFPVVGTGFQFWFLMGLGIALCGGRE